VDEGGRVSLAKGGRLGWPQIRLHRARVDCFVRAQLVDQRPQQSGLDPDGAGRAELNL
jgi:hypothetical protein